MTIKVYLYESPLKTKKYRVIWYKDGEKIKHTDFGAKKMSDYTIHKDKERMERYLARHKKRENWNDAYSAGALSRWVLWNKPNLKESWLDYKKRFGFK